MLNFQASRALCHVLRYSREGVRSCGCGVGCDLEAFFFLAGFGFLGAAFLVSCEKETDFLDGVKSESSHLGRLLSDAGYEPEGNCFLLLKAGVPYWLSALKLDRCWWCAKRPGGGAEIVVVAGCEVVAAGLPSELAPLSFRPNRFQAGTADMMGR